MIKMVICADTHLNAYYARMRPEQLEKRRESLRRAFKTVVDFAIEEKVDIFLHAGDLFDMPDPRYLEIIYVFSELMRLRSTGIKTFIIGGTHDIPKAKYEAGGIPSLFIFEIANLAKVFRKFYSAETEIIDINGQRIAIAGVSCDPRLREGNPLRALDFAPPQADYTIFMFHYAIEGKMPSKYEGAVVPIAQLRELPAEFIIGGHLHPHSHFDMGGKYVIIPGATERLDFGEEKNECGFYYVELGKNPKIRYQKISAQPMRTLEIHTAEINKHPKDKWFPYLVSRIKEVSHPQQLLRCRIFGEIDKDYNIHIPINRLREEGNAGNFYFDLDIRELKIKGVGIDVGGGISSVTEEIEQAAASLMKEKSEAKELIEEAKRLALARWGEAR